MGPMHSETFGNLGVGWGQIVPVGHSTQCLADSSGTPVNRSGSRHSGRRVPTTKALTGRLGPLWVRKVAGRQSLSPMPPNCLKLLVGAQGLEPWAR